MKGNKNAVFLFLILLSFTTNLFGQDTIKFASPGTNLRIGNEIELLEDKTSSLSFNEALQSHSFVKSNQEIPNLQITSSSFWVKFTVKNETPYPVVVLLAYPTIDSVAFYSPDATGKYNILQSGEFIPIGQRSYKHQDYVFDLDLKANQAKTYYLKVNSSEQFQLPMSIGTPKEIEESLLNEDLIFGIYFGIIFVMFFYNLFLFFTVKDNSYLYYISYIIFVGLTQACLQGYAPRLFYPNSYFLANFMMVLVPALVGISAIMFLQNFMQVKKHTPILYKSLLIMAGVYIVCIFLGLLQYNRPAASILQANVGVLAFVVVTIGIKIMRKGYRPAYYFMLAWSIFIAGVVVFVLRNFNVLPYNMFTYYSMEIGSSIEVILLSFALADRINTYRKEREESQLQAQLALQENVRIVKEQNIILDQKVNERTIELKQANTELNKAMVELKEAEAQLVESEKMASLGQLTAGIAHEINNPINFVTSNVKPLNRDVRILLGALDDMEELALQESSTEVKKTAIDALKADMDYDYLKIEIDQLLSGITEGAIRTADIVKGLRVFSRLDEDDLKKADLNEGIESTLIIINNLLSGNIKVEKAYSKLPFIECYPGKLNQVFLNILSNGIYAIKKKFQEKQGGVLTIKTYSDTENVFVSITDNGTGMDENTKKKLFEPFFTTKDVGEGTGLGLSIVYNTISKHDGQIIVNTEIGVGTEFILKLPLIHK